MKITSKSRKIGQVFHPWRIWAGVDNRTQMRALSRRKQHVNPLLAVVTGTGNTASGQRGASASVSRLWAQMFTGMSGSDDR